MPEDSGEVKLGYHQRMGLLQEELAISLIEHGLEATIEKARTEAVNFGHDYLFIMRGAAMDLVETGDPAVQEHSLTFFTWQAENFPTTNDGMNLIYTAKDHGNYAETEQEKYFFRRLCEVGLLHYQLSIQADGFEPDTEFISELSSSLAYLEEGNHHELQVPLLQIVADTVIAIAQSHVSINEDLPLGRDYRKSEIDGVLGYIHSYLKKSEPAKARLAKSLITDESELAFIERGNKSKVELEAFMELDQDAIREILEGKGLEANRRLWDPMRKLLLESDESDIAYATRVVDAVREAAPDYLNSRGKPDKSIGRDTGQIIGMLGHINAINDCIGVERKPSDTYLTAGGIAYGLGIGANNSGFEHLLARVAHFSDELKAIIQSNFERGLQESVKVPSDF